MENKPWVYIASPYTRGDAAINTRFQMQVFDDLLSDNLVWPLVPLWSHFQHIVYPRPYADWVNYDLALLPRMDACLRLNASYESPGLDYEQSESSGADGEVAEFTRLGKPVFYSKGDLYDWVRSGCVGK